MTNPLELTNELLELGYPIKAINEYIKEKAWETLRKFEIYQDWSREELFEIWYETKNGTLKWQELKLQKKL